MHQCREVTFWSSTQYFTTLWKNLAPLVVSPPVRGLFCPKEAKEGRKGLKGAFSWDCSGNVAAVGRALVQEADLDIATSALFHTAGLELIFNGGQFRS